MTTTLNFCSANLSRYPAKHAKDLQAWDAADEYLAEFILAKEKILIVNDSFGAIDWAVRACDSVPSHINDSWCSFRAIATNSGQDVEYFDSQSPARALMKLPKSLSLLEAQLKKIAGQINSPLEMYFSGMQKHVGSGHLELLKKMLGDLVYLPTQRKARMYKAELQPMKYEIVTSDLHISELGLTLKNAPGVFAEQKMDIGSRFFIEHFNLLPSAHSLADVGCGNGLLALAYHQQHPAASLTLVDESAAAVESAKLSFSLNAPDANYQISHGDGLVEQKQVFDLILINPPFHQQNTVTTDIALSMFAQSKLCMNNASELWIVANRHLNYQSDLRRWFRRTFVAAQNEKFVIIRAKL